MGKACPLTHANDASGLGKETDYVANFLMDESNRFAAESILQRRITFYALRIVKTRG